METNTILKKIYKRTLLQYIAYTVGLLVIFVLAVYLAAFFDFQWVYDSDMAASIGFSSTSGASSRATASINLIRFS